MEQIKPLEVYRFVADMYSRRCRLLWFTFCGLTSLLLSVFFIVPALLLRSALTDALVKYRPGALVVPVLAIAAVALVESSLSSFKQYRSRKLGEALNRRLRLRVIKCYQDLPLDVTLHVSTGALVSRILRDSMEVSIASSSTFSYLLDDASRVTFGLALLFFLSWPLCLASLVVLPLASIVARKAQRGLTQAMDESVQAMTAFSGNLTERLSPEGLQLAALLGARDEAAGLLEDNATRVMLAELRRARYEGRASGFLGVVNAIASLAVLATGVGLVAGHLISLSTFIVFALYLAMLYNPLLRVFEAPTKFSKPLVAGRRLVRLLRTSALTEAAYITPPTEGVMTPSITRLPLQRRAPCSEPPAVLMDNVSLRYFSSSIAAGLGLEVSADKGSGTFPPVNESLQEERAVFSNLCLRVNKFDRVCLIGPSGAGKSTLLALCSGTLLPTTGHVQLFGNGTRGLEAKERAKIAHLLTQQPFFLRASVRANLCYGLGLRTDEELLDACAMANALAVVEQLPHGLDTVLGEEGLTLSGGERQRLALARALLRDPPLLLLDEPTAHLDRRAASAVEAGLASVCRTRTVIAATHGNGRIIDANRLIVVQHGALREVADDDPFWRRFDGMEDMKGVQAR